MNRKIFFAIISLFLLFGLISVTLWAGSFFRIKGFFTPEATWMWGHPGKITFDLDPVGSGSSASIDTQGYLSGYFWLSTVGWATFSHGAGPGERPQILCSDAVFRNPNLTCPLTGFAWSQHAGWIMLSGATIDGGSGVYYNPSTRLIEGFWYSRSVGWVPFFANSGDVVLGSTVTNTAQTGVTLNGIGVNFIGKIAIIGNIAGSRIFNLPNQQVGDVFSGINHADILNTIKKNISILTRNRSSMDISNPFPNGLDFQLIAGDDLDTRIGGWAWPSSKSTIIVRGGDVILDQASPTNYIGDSTSTHPRALIVLKDANGKWGNIVITNRVKRIYAFIYAEWVVYSGEKISGVIRPYGEQWVWNIPAEQIYIKGGIISKNTIGGSMQDPPVCPVVIGECTQATAQTYDLNYFRTYDTTDPTQKSAPYSDPRIEHTAVIIEYDPNILIDTPPWLDTILQ